MGIYLVSADSTSFEDEESSWGEVFLALDAEFRSRGIDAVITLPVRRDLPRGSGHGFEEKLIPSMDGFVNLCQAELGENGHDAFNWCLMVPVDFSGSIELPLPCYYDNVTIVRSAQRMLTEAKRLAVSTELPLEEIPAMCDNLQLTEFFMDDGPTGVRSRGRWLEDLDTSFYVAMYLRAAEHSIRLNTPMYYV